MYIFESRLRREKRSMLFAYLLALSRARVMCCPFSLKGLLLLGVSMLMLSPSFSWAEVDQVIVVPFSQQNTALPHPAHEGAPITLKAIIRDAQCASYDIRWDINRNGNYNDDFSFTANRNNNSHTVTDIGRSFVVPYVDRDKPLNINVRAHSNCGGGDKFGTFRLFVYNFGESGEGVEKLSRDPRDWSDEQFEILVTMAIQEALWHTHRSMGGHSGHNNVGIEAHTNYSNATAIGQWFFVINNHLPAYPPVSLDQNDPAPDGWYDLNASRWNKDPYAESAMRLLNYNVSRTGSEGIPASDEDNTCGYRGNNPVRCDRIPGVDDRSGLYARSNNVYLTGMHTGSISTILPALFGTNIKVGPAAGNSWNWYVQQLVDFLGYQQIDNGGCPKGGWYYHTIDNGGCRYADLSTSQWAYIGLESAEVAGGPYGVFVNNRHKFRISNMLVNNQKHGDGGGSYDNTGRARSDLKLTGGQLLAARWLDLHNRQPNGNNPYPNESDFNARTLRESYDGYWGFVQTWFTQRRVSGSLGWQDGIWQHGDYLCGNTNTIYNGGRCGNTYSLYSHQKAYHTGTPVVHHVGNHDWYRYFATYYVRAQYRTANNDNGRDNYGDIGGMWDDYCEVHSVSCVYGPRHMSTIMAGLVLTPAVFKPKPVALGEVSNTVVTEGCVPGNGRVTFSHDDSFHPNSDSRIVAYYWDVDNKDGLWWETGANPDLDVNGEPLRTANVLNAMTHSYLRRGQYVPTLRVEDNVGLFKQTTLSIITVNAAADTPPSIATGGPYIIEVGDDLELNGSASDSNLNCGDKLSIAWNLDYSLEAAGNHSFEAEGEKPRVLWNNNNGLGNLSRNAPNRIQVRVTDQFIGDNEDPVVEETTLWIYDKDPIAEARANPAVVACHQDVTFDGSNSYHPNPQRTIADYQWSVEDRTSDRPIFSTNFGSFGEREARLVVTDDLGRESISSVIINVNQGNLPPVIRIANDQITVMSNEVISLDARQSSDPNADCGDEIEAYEWDLLADGVRLNGDQGADAVGSQVNIAIADWHQAMGWDQNNEMIIRLTARDTLGGTSTKDIRVNAVRAEPIPVITQIPDPSPYRIDNGFSSTRLDGRESISLLEGVTIARYEWDINCDGAYEREQGQFLYEKIFEPNTRLEDIQANPIMVCLRVTDSSGNEAISAPYEIQYQELGSTSPFADADPSDAPETGYHILEEEALILDGSRSFDPDSQEFDDFIREYSWTVAGINNPSMISVANDLDDIEAALLEINPGDLAEMGVEERGEYEISLRVTDVAGNTGNDFSTLTIHRKTADINVVINPENASPNTRVTFDASRSEHSHPDISVSQVIWFFGELIAVGGDCDTDQDCAEGYCINNPQNDTLQCMDGLIGSQEGEIVNQTFDEITPEDGDAIAVTVVVRDTSGGQSQSGDGDDGDFNEGDDGNSTRFGIRVDQGNRLPVANPGGGTNVDGDEVVGNYTIIDTGTETVIFDGSDSRDPDEEYGDEIVSYTWLIGNCVCSSDLILHGNCPIDSAQVGPTLPEISVDQLSQCQIDGVGEYNISLTVTDRFGQFAESESSLNIIDGPVAHAQADPNRTGCQQLVTFDGRGSTSTGPGEQGFNIVSYEWDLDGDVDFHDPFFIFPVTALPVGNPPRVILNARLTVTNAIGQALIDEGIDPGPHQGSDDIQVIIDIQNIAPVSNPGGPYRTGGSQQTGFAPVTIDGRGSIDPNAPCDSIHDYWWDTDGDESYGLDDNDGPTTIDGQRSDYIGPIVSFTDDNWQPNTTVSVGLKVRDQFGVWSIPSLADITIDNVIPPSGSIVSPRGGECAVDDGNGHSRVDVLVSHPAPQPEPVIVTITIAGEVVGQHRIANFNEQREATAQIDINLENIPEGLHDIVSIFTLESNNQSQTTTNSGGRVSFDFTAPIISLGAQPVENVCYVNGRVPAAEFDVNDNFDDAPQVSQSIIENGCGRTLRVVARDYCGRESSVERQYLIAQSNSVNIDGVVEGSLQEDAKIEWVVEGLAACASDIEASLSRDGGAQVPYAENTLINTPGDYSLRISIFNCSGVPRDQIVNFRVNRSPIAVPRPEGHPNADINILNGYIVSEGSPLMLDGGTSTAPEFDDEISAYMWTIAGQQDLVGVNPLVITLDDGVFNGSLTVEDLLGKTHSESFQITIRDIDPIANVGGPYTSNQGDVIRFDATQSRSLNPDADEITRYVWSWNDGTPDSEGAIQDHAFNAQGVYNVKLSVYDEDSHVEKIASVIIADVNPQVDSVYITHILGEINEERPEPVVGYEVMNLDFEVNAIPGAEGDPITLYQWDFDGDNIFEINTVTPDVTWQFTDPGLYNIGVLVHDRDSFTLHAQVVEIKPLNFWGVFEFIEYSVQAKINRGGLNVLNAARLAGISDDIAAGVWGQMHDGIESNADDELKNGPSSDRANRLHLQSQGISFLAAQRILSALIQVQLRDEDFSTEVWALSRQLRREFGYDISALDSDSEGLYENRVNDIIYQRRIAIAGDYLSDVINLYEDPDFEEDVYDLNQTQGHALILQHDARRGLDWINIAIDQCADPRFQSFVVNNDASNPASYFNDAEEIRVITFEALTGMLSEMEEYINRGANGFDAPARNQIAAAADSLEELLSRAALNMSSDCDENCSNNESALEIALEAMNLIDILQAANVSGAYVMHWQSCLVEYLRFRIKANLVAIKTQCGLFNPLYLKAKDAFNEGEKLLSEDDDIIGALNFYTDAAQRCLILDVYNKCLVNIDSTIEFHPYPDVCLE